MYTGPLELNDICGQLIDAFSGLLVHPKYICPITRNPFQKSFSLEFGPSDSAVSLSLPRQIPGYTPMMEI